MALYLFFLFSKVGNKVPILTFFFFLSLLETYLYTIELLISFMIHSFSQLTFHHEHNIYIYIYILMRYRFEALNIYVCHCFCNFVWAFSCLTTLLLYACQNPYLFYELAFCFLIFMLEI